MHRHGYSPGAMQHSVESKVASESQHLLPLSTAEWCSSHAERPVGVSRGANGGRVKSVKGMAASAAPTVCTMPRFSAAARKRAHSDEERDLAAESISAGRRYSSRSPALV